MCLFLVPALFYDVCVTCDNDAGLLKSLAWCRGDGLLTPARHASGRERGGTNGDGEQDKKQRCIWRRYVSLKRRWCVCVWKKLTISIIREKKGRNEL